MQKRIYIERIATKKVFSIGNRDKYDGRILTVVEIFSECLMYDAKL